MRVRIRTSAVSLRMNKSCGKKAKILQKEESISRMGEIRGRQKNSRAAENAAAPRTNQWVAINQPKGGTSKEDSKSKDKEEMIVEGQRSNQELSLEAIVHKKSGKNGDARFKAKEKGSEKEKER